MAVAGGWVEEVARFRSEGEARLLAGRLEAEGLSAGIRGVGGSRLAGSAAGAVAVAYVVTVAASDLERARKLAAEDHSHLLEAEFPGYSASVLPCERCGSASVVVESRGGWIGGLMRLLFGVELRRRRCEVCGSTW